MADEKLLGDFEEAIINIEKVQAFLDTLYYVERIGTLHNKPALSLLITACKYLVNNMQVLKTLVSVSKSGL